jgi:hypothetical protein
MDIQSKELDRIFERIAKRYGIHKNTVRMVVASEFEMTKQTMKKVDSYNGFFPYIRLPYFCVFKVKKGKQDFFKEKSKKIIDNVYSESKQTNDRTEDSID